MPLLQANGLRTHHLGPLDLRVDGGCVTLHGPSGSGKTLLLRALADLDPHQGEVRLDGREQRDHTGPHWRRMVGYLPADSHWWAEQVGPHFPGGEIDPALLDALGFPPEVVGWEVARLSSGERQRLGLARLLSGHPRVLLLDEPTANLDGATGLRVEGLLADYRARHGCALLWVSHDPAQRQRVGERHLRIQGSALVEDGP